jgi:hypothetical protein
MKSVLFRSMERRRQRENFLTQALSAAFNMSGRFRREFGELIGVDCDPKGARMRIQEGIRGSAGSRLSICDAVIFAGRRDMAVIEVKFDAVLSADQLAKYEANMAGLYPRSDQVERKRATQLRGDVKKFMTGKRSDYQLSR